MGRLTTNKPVDEMSMLELAYNSCYAKDGKSMYEDYETVRDARDFARNLYKAYLNEELPTDDEEFDGRMMDDLQYESEVHLRGLIALFYRNLWAMADMRERLKTYEDKQEQGLLIEAKKLKAYEETGLDPDRAEEINELYLEKCKEVNRLEAKLEEYRDYAENILQQLIAVSFECRGHEVGMGGQKVVAMDDVVEILKGEV